MYSVTYAPVVKQILSAYTTQYRQVNAFRETTAHTSCDPMRGCAMHQRAKRADEPGRVAAYVRRQVAARLAGHSVFRARHRSRRERDDPFESRSADDRHNLERRRISAIQLRTAV